MEREDRVRIALSLIERAAKHSKSNKSTNYLYGYGLLELESCDEIDVAVNDFYI